MLNLLFRLLRLRLSQPHPDWYEEDAELPFMPRSAIMLVPTPLYLRWVKSWYRECRLTLDEARRDATVYLIPDIDDRADARTYVEYHYERLWENELSSWTKDRDLWPEMSLQLFRQWYDIEYRDGVVDWAGWAHDKSLYD